MELTPEQTQSYLELKNAATALSDAACRLQEAYPDDPTALRIKLLCVGIAGLLLNPLALHHVHSAAMFIIDISRKIIAEHNQVPS